MQGIRNPRRREQLLEQIREHITPFVAKGDDLVSQMILAHAPDTRYTLLLGMIPEQGEGIHLLLDDAFVLTLDIPRTGNPSIGDIVVEKEDAAEYCRKNGAHLQWLWAAVCEMRALWEHTQSNELTETGHD